jgi:cytochrome o ubiquinol oxidase subunit 1
MLYISLRDQIPAASDSWGTGRTLEWLTHTPVPFYNFAVTPQINSRDELAWRKANGVENVQPTQYVPIHLPNSTAVPFLIGALSAVFGFAITWRIWWLSIASLAAIVIIIIIRSFDKNEGYVLSAEEIARLESRPDLASIIAEQPKRSSLAHVEAI